jgi:hypothetical protein
MKKPVISPDLQFSITSLSPVLAVPAIQSYHCHQNNAISISNTHTKKKNKTLATEGTGQKYRWSGNRAFEKYIMTTK